MTGLGDAVKTALEAIGVTEERVACWLDRECGGCKRRQEKLNELGWWASRVVKGSLKNARQVLEDVLNEK